MATIRSTCTFAGVKGPSHEKCSCSISDRDHVADIASAGPPAGTRDKVLEFNATGGLVSCPTLQPQCSGRRLRCMKPLRLLWRKRFPASCATTSFDVCRSEYG